MLASAATWCSSKELTVTSVPRETILVLNSEQSGHQGAQAPVGDAGDGAQGDAQGAGQGLDPRVAETHGCSSPPLRVNGGVRDPLEDWIRKDAGLAGTFSVQQPGVDRTCPGLKLIEVMQAPLAAQVTRRVDDGFHPQGAAVFEVLLDAGVLVEGVDGHVYAPGDDLGLEFAFGAGPDLPVEDDLQGVRAAEAGVVGHEGVEEGPGVARLGEHDRAGDL